MGKDLALIPSEQGKYDYAWADRWDPRACDVKSIEIVERVGEVDGPTSAAENLLIMGDSGDALRSLGTVPEYVNMYRGKVKLVYIDPPFNTEQAFEHYADQLEHSVWLTMMRDRIRDIKPLMAEDASIWVHLDDAEVHRMRVLLDEEFGEDKFVATIVWQKKYSRDNRPAIGTVHDYILVYAMQGAAQWKHARNRIPRVNASQYRNPNNDPEGAWRPIPLDVQGGHATASQFYDVETPSGKVVRPANGRAWSVTEPVMQAMIERGEIYFGQKGDGMPNTIRYLKDDEGLVPWTWWPHDEVGNNDDSKKEIIALFGDENPFDTPKPERLMERIIHIGSNPGDLVLDCFGGSGTTAAVSHKLGRRWITVELSERNAEAFIRPRLAGVVAGTDNVGISVRDGEGFTDEVFNGVIKPADAKILLRAFSALAKTGSLKSVAEPDADALAKELRQRLKPAPEPAAVRSGGGFTVARMGPSMYEVDDETGEVYLSPDATTEAWSKAVAGQLGYTYTPDDPVFCGVKRRMRLAVIDGIADAQVVRTVVEHLGEGERAMVVAKAVIPDAETLLKELSPGSRLRKAPDDLFPKATVK
ncbi:site-specific DNA-methyltransferase [Geodermatophilus sp. CPCC 205761]|uniref:site-specific DNA-methyltransferase n=1 Tax=Geodermatophilus sp. CPCC 205761 TaxID=2936597 RepID=UPI003EEBD158